LDRLLSFSSTIDRETALEYLHRVADALRASAYDRLMLERDIPAMLSSGDLFFTTQDFLELARGYRVAFVNRYATLESAMEFAILIGTNRGADYKLFPDADAAEDWLLSKTRNRTLG
jgi:hypothetical protein